MTRLRLWLRDARRLVKEVCRHLPGLKRPEQVQIDITDRCNYRCPTCTKWHQRSAEGELSTAEWKGFFDNAARMSLTRRIVFAGGEPLLRDDLAELVAHCHGLGYSTVVISNGSLLDAARLHSLDGAGLSYLMVSLNSLEPAIHDGTRGVEGSCDHILEVIRTYCSGPRRVKLGIATVLMAANLGGIMDLLDFVKQHRLHGFLIQACMDDLAHHPFRGEPSGVRGAEWFAANQLLPSGADAVDRVIDRLLARQRSDAPVLNPPSQLQAMKTYFHAPRDYTEIDCLAGVTSFLVDPYGDVRICFGLDAFANVLDCGDPRAIWTCTAANEARKRAAACQRPCRIMNHIY